MDAKSILSALCCSCLPLGAALPDSLSLDAKILIQGAKYEGPSTIATSQTGNNLDEWWGRTNVAANYHAPGMKSQIAIKMYPSNFGFEPLIKANLVSDSTNSSYLKTQATKIDLFVLSDAWVSFPAGPLDVKLGRFESFLGTGTGFFGDYIDEDLYCGFLYKGATHNGVDFYKTYGSNFTSVMIQSGDRNLNTGRLRLQQSYNADGLELDLAYRYNLFDFIRTANHATAEHRAHGVAAFGNPKAWRVYGEAAGIWKESDDRFQKVVLLGLNIPSMGLFEQVSLEAEYAVDRTIADDNGKTMDKPLLWNLQCSRKVGAYLQGIAAIFADPRGGSAADIGFGARITAPLW